MGPTKFVINNNCYKIKNNQTIKDNKGSGEDN